MIIGTPAEIKRHEYRVGLTPTTAGTYVAHGHSVVMESGAGIGAGYSDDEYRAAGVELVRSADEVFQRSDMIVKVKEPQPSEYTLLREGQILYTYLHLAASESLTKALLNRKINGVAYETIEDSSGLLPCLKPMSEIAGRMAIQEGAKYLERPTGGRGVLLGGVPGEGPAEVAIIGAGTVGINACQIAVGMRARVTVLDINVSRLEYIDKLFNGAVRTLISNRSNLEHVLEHADLLIGAVLVPGARAPRIVIRNDLSRMKQGAVIVDVAVDQGGCFETTRPTTHDDPVYEVDGVIHYCVANIPGAVSRTSTGALNNATLPYGLTIADNGIEEAVRTSSAIRAGLNVFRGNCVNASVAEAFQIQTVGLEEIVWSGEDHRLTMR